MTHVLELKLYKKYPKLFKDVDKNIQESCMAWGIECGDGWYTLIDSVSAKLTKLKLNIRYTQIKEKFGRLTIYFATSAKINNKKLEKIYKIIDTAEEISYTICENCGKKATLTNTHGWKTTLCKACIDKNN